LLAKSAQVIPGVPVSGCEINNRTQHAARVEEQRRTYTHLCLRGGEVSAALL